VDNDAAPSPDASLDGGGSEAATSDAPAGIDGAGNDAGVDSALDASACAADLQADPKHCGACFHDCSGGTCNAGLCRLTPPSVSLQGGAQLTLTSDQVVFTLGGIYDMGVFACPKQGCASAGPKRLTVDIDAQAEFEPMGVTTYGAYVYWTNYYNGTIGGVYRTPLDGGTSVRVSKGDSYKYSTSVAVSDGGIFWTNDEFDQKVAHCPLGMCGDASAAQYPQAAGGFSGGLAVADDGSIVWSENAQIVRCTTPACAGGPVASGAVGASGPLAIEGTTIYFTNEIIHGIIRCPLTGCGGATSVVVDSQPENFRSLAVSKGFLYWTHGGTVPAPLDGGLTTDGLVRRCEIANCAATVTDIAMGQAAPEGVVADDKSVYWITSGRLNEVGAPSAVFKAPR
jgi:hypothetical protein